MTGAAPLGSISYLDSALEFVCRHCKSVIEIDDALIDEPLHPLELDSEGYSRDWIELDHFHQNCEYCGGVLVFGYEHPCRIYVAGGRSEADLRYLEIKESEENGHNIKSEENEKG